MSWILLTVVAQFISAGVALADKYIVTSGKAMPRPFVYAFYTTILAGLWVLVFVVGILPLPYLSSIQVPSLLNVEFPTWGVALLSLAAAYAFFGALVTFYMALKDADASDVVPVVGAVSAVGSFVLGYLFLDIGLTPNFFVGLILLSVGTLLVSHLRFRWQTAFASMYAGALFALHYVIIKELFNETTFDNGFFWSRAAFFLAALSTLLIPGYYAKIHSQTKNTSAKSGLLVLGTKFLAGISSILILKATALGSVSLVQALGGLQFVFILFFTFFLGHKTPPEYGEKVTHDREIWHKALFVSMIVIGFAVLFV